MQKLTEYDVLAILSEIGVELKKERKRQELCQNDVCEVTGIGKSQLSMIENGMVRENIPFDSYIRLIAAYGASLKVVSKTGKVLFYTESDEEEDGECLDSCMIDNDEAKKLKNYSQKFDISKIIRNFVMLNRKQKK